MAQNNELAPMWARLITRYWHDPEFAEQFKLDPATVFQEMGIPRVGTWSVSEYEGLIDVSDGSPGDPKKLPWLEDGRLQLVIPAAPAGTAKVDVAEEELELVAGGQKTIDGMPKSVYDYRKRHGEDPTDPIYGGGESGAGTAAAISGAGEAAADAAWMAAM